MLPRFIHVNACCPRRSHYVPPRLVGILGLAITNARKLDAKNNWSGKNAALTRSRTLTTLKKASAPAAYARMNTVSAATAQAAYTTVTQKCARVNR